MRAFRTAFISDIGHGISKCIYGFYPIVHFLRRCYIFQSSYPGGLLVSVPPPGQIGSSVKSELR